MPADLSTGSFFQGLQLKELHICGFEDIDSSPYDLFYTLALGKAMTELTSLTKLHLENQHEKVEEFDEFDDGMSSRIAHPPVLKGEQQ